MIYGELLGNYCPDWVQTHSALISGCSSPLSRHAPSLMGLDGFLCTGLWGEQDEVIHSGAGGETVGWYLRAQRRLWLRPHLDDSTM